MCIAQSTWHASNKRVYPATIRLKLVAKEAVQAPRLSSELRRSTHWHCLMAWATATVHTSTIFHLYHIGCHIVHQSYYILVFLQSQESCFLIGRTSSCPAERTQRKGTLAPHCISNSEPARFCALLAKLLRIARCLGGELTASHTSELSQIWRRRSMLLSVTLLVLGSPFARHT